MNGLFDKDEYEKAVAITDRIEQLALRFAKNKTAHEDWHISLHDDYVNLIPYDNYGESIESNYSIDEIKIPVIDLIKEHTCDLKQRLGIKYKTIYETEHGL